MSTQHLTPPAVLLLGPPQIRAGGAAHRFVNERSCQLLVYLAVRADWVSRDRLASLFWPGHEVRAARNNLRKVLFAARGAPWHADLALDGERVRWIPDSDLARFIEAFAGAEWMRADATYRGRLCEGLEDGASAPWLAWLLAERNRLHEKWRVAALQAIETQPPDGALALVERLRTFDALDEEALRAQLRCLHALGRDVEAAHAYREYAERLAGTLAVEVSRETRELAFSLRSDRAPLQPDAARAASVIAPPAGDPFIGRAAELKEGLALLAHPDCGLLTISGPGGIGKSRLAKEIVRRASAAFPDGIFWIALDDLDDVAAVAPRIATAAGIDLPAQGDPIRQIAASLRGARALLVFDNAEHLPRLRATLAALQDGASVLRILVTSRARTGCAGEWLMPIGGLPVPPPAAPWTGAENFDAVRLFVAAAHAAYPAFDAAACGVHIVALVRALGGLPLAILLAAHWVRILPVCQLAADATASLDVLERAEDGDERPEHRSVRATFEQSWRLLAPLEQRALAALAVFVGTFSRYAAHAVADASLPLLAALADKSVLQADGAGRFSLHPLMAQFARERLDVSGRLHEVQRRHAQWYHEFLARDRHRHDVLDEIERDLENCRAAWRWAVAQRAVPELAAACLTLMTFFQARGRPAEGLVLLQEAAASLDVDRPGDLPALAGVLNAIAQLEYRLGQLEKSIDTARRSLQICRQVGLREPVLGCLNVTGLASWQRGDFAGARRYFEQGLKRGRAMGELPIVATFVGNLALIDLATGEYDRAQQLFEQGLEQRHKLGDMLGAVVEMNGLGMAHRVRGHWREAEQVLEDGLRLCDRHGFAGYRVYLRGNLGVVALATGDLARAATLADTNLAESRAAGNRQMQTHTRLLQARIALARHDVDAARAALSEAIALLLADGNVPLQLDGLACLAELMAAAGKPKPAAQLLRFVEHHPLTEAPDRADARARLASLPAQERRAKAAAPISIDAVLRDFMAAGTRTLSC